MKHAQTRTPTVALSLAEIDTLVARIFCRHYCDEANTRALTRTVVTAERDGSTSHGLFRVPGYVASLKSGKVNGSAVPKVELRSPGVVAVDGDDGFAPLALERGVPALARAARAVGVAVMAVTRTYHFAALWPETEALADQGLIGMACTSYMPCVTPSGGREALFGTNPLSFAWPRPGLDPIVIDMATSAMARGEIEIAAREGYEVPLGTGLNEQGELTTDPKEILSGVLLPFGGYKGSAISLMVELLAAGAVGEHFSFEAGDADNRDGGPPRGGEFLLAIAPEALAGPGWIDHCEKFFERFERIEGARLPGARRFRNRQSLASREVNAALVDQIRALCQ